MVIATLASFATFETIRTGELKPCLFLYFPGVHNYSVITSILLAAYNYMMVTLSFFCMAPGDTLFFLIFVNLPMLRTIIQSRLKHLDDVLDDEKGSYERNEARKVLIEVLLMHQRYNG